MALINSEPIFYAKKGEEIWLYTTDFTLNKSGKKYVNTIWNVAKDKNGDDWGSFRYSFSPDIIGYVNMKYLKKI